MVWWGSGSSSNGCGWAYTRAASALLLLLSRVLLQKEGVVASFALAISQCASTCRAPLNKRYAFRARHS
jgi:hypothetical protein